MTPLESTRIGAVGYDPTSRRLRVAFVKGGIYDYQGVPPHHYAELSMAYSPGTYLNDNIIGQYEFSPYTPSED